MKIIFLLLITLASILATEVTHHESAVKQHADVHTGQHHSTITHVKKAGKSSKHEEEIASKGHSDAVHHKKKDEESGGKKSVGYEHGTHSNHHTEGASSRINAESKDHEKYKKGSSIKGFREQYHKNEHKKHDSYYSNAHKGGSWKNFGQKGSKYQSHKVEKLDNGKHITLKSNEKHGKQSKKIAGHKNDDHVGHKLQKGKKSGHSKHDKWGKSSQQKSQNKHKYKYVPAAKF